MPVSSQSRTHTDAHARVRAHLVTHTDGHTHTRGGHSPVIIQMDFRGLGAPSGDSRDGVQLARGEVQLATSRVSESVHVEMFVGLSEITRDAGPPSDNGFQGRGGQSGGQEDNSGEARSDQTRMTCGVSSNRIGQDNVYNFRTYRDNFIMVTAKTRGWR